MPLRFSFKEDPIIILNKDRADPQKIGEAIERHAENNGGQIRPRTLLDEARAPRHALHPHIEWKDAVAAEKYRLDQVRELIRIVKVIDSDTDDETPRRAFLNLADKDDGHSYRTIKDVLNSADLQLRVLQAAERDLESFEERYRDLLEICELVRAAREAVKEKREAMEAKPPKKKGGAREART